MFDPHAQHIRYSHTFERDGPNVTKLNKAAELAPRKIWFGQCETRENKKLNDDNKIIYLNNFLKPSERIKFIQQSYMAERSPAKEGGNHNKLEFTRNGKPYYFSPYPHKTTSFSENISFMSRKVLEQIGTIESTEHDLMDSATEIEYGIGMVNGGSIEKTADTEGEWKHVGFVAFGQTRYLRITKKGARGFINIPLIDNTLVVLSGINFQKYYNHQVDMLPEDHPTGESFLLKLRYRKPLLSGTKTI